MATFSTVPSMEISSYSLTGSSVTTNLVYTVPPKTFALISGANPLAAGFSDIKLGISRNQSNNTNGATTQYDLTATFGSSVWPMGVGEPSDATRILKPGDEIYLINPDGLNRSGTVHITTLK